MGLGITAQKLLNRALEPIGARFVRLRPERDTPRLFALKARQAGVGTVLDVGANVGQFGHWMRGGAGWNGRIVSFEPLSAAHAQLAAAAAGDPQWIVPPAMALGAENGEAVINVSANSVSSSFLDITENSTRVRATSGFAGSETVRVARLDDVREPGWTGPFALKLDTQGFELEVLKGASAILAETVVIVTELSLAPLYRGGASVARLFDLLEEAGFRAICVTEGFVDHARNEVLQVDAVFVRS